MDNTKDRSVDLPPRAMQIFHYTVEMKTAKEIGQLMQISPNTVYAQQRIIYDRCRVRSAKALRQLAIDRGMIQG